MIYLRHKTIIAVLLIQITSLLLVGCSVNETKVVYNIEPVDITNPDSEKLNLRSISDSISYILLDTPEELALGQLDRAQLTDDRIFVLDREIAAALYVFDRRGKYIFDIQEGIGGPGEVLEFSDFDVDEIAQELYILDNERMDIKVFDFAGEFVRSIRLPFYAASLSVMGDEIAIFRNNQFDIGDEWGNHQVVIFSKSGELKRGFMPISKETNYFSYHDSFRPLHATDKGWIFSQALNDTIFEISGSTINAKFKIDFGDQSLGKIEGGFFGINNFLQSEQRMKSLYLMGDTFDRSDYLLSLFFAGKTYKYLFYDKRSEHTSVVNRIENDIDYVPILHIKYANNDYYLMADLPAELLLSLDEQMETVTGQTQKIHDLVNDPVFEKENPVLMLIHLKSRE